MNKAIYWCIKSSIESENYGDNDVRRPWRGVLTSANKLSFINDHEVIDRDNNATAIVDDEDLFETEEEAKKAFIKARHCEIQNLLKLVAEKLKEIQ